MAPKDGEAQAVEGALSVGMGQDSTSWQTKCGGLSARLGAVRARGLWTDCELLVGEEKAPVGVHRLLLAAASPVLAAMLYGPLANSDKPLHLPDIDTKTFKLLLEYMYTDNITISSCDVASSVYKAANYLILPHVQEICKTFIINNLSPKSVLSTYEFSELYGDEEIMDKCLKMMSTSTTAVLENVENVQAKTLQQLFALPSLSIVSELDLFQAAEQWVHARCSASLIQKHGADLRKGETKPIAPENEDAKELAAGNIQPMEAENGKVDSASGDNKDPIKLKSDYHSNEGADCGAGGDTKYVKLECNGDAIPNKESFDDLDKKNNAKMLIRGALKEIRFLTMDLEEFAGYDMSTLLSDSEMLAISLNLMSTKCHRAMPDGFSLSREIRNQLHVFHFEDFNWRRDRPEINIGEHRWSLELPSESEIVLYGSPTVKVDDWYCDVKYQIKIRSQRRGVPDLFIARRKSFSRKNNKFLEILERVDWNNGYTTEEDRMYMEVVLIVVDSQKTLRRWQPRKHK